MKAAAFSYEKPATIAEAIRLKSRHGAGARFLAGGQSLVPALNLRLDRPDLLIDINALADLEAIDVSAGTLRIGALVRHAALAKSSLVAEAAPLLARAAQHIAHPAIRNVGTIGGSIALADPAAEWPAACLALDANLVAVGPEGERTIAVRDFFLGLYETALMTDELLVRIDIPVASPAVRATALEVTRRRGDFAIAGVMMQAVPGPGGALGDVRAAFFGVADRPVRFASVERALSAGAGIEVAHAALAQELQPQADLYHGAPTKLHLAKVLLARALAQLTA